MANRTVLKPRDGVGKPCCYCRRTMVSHAHIQDENPITRGLVCSVEHIRPKAKNGSNDKDNLTWACARCNSLRGHLDYDVFDLFARVVLKNYPNVPTIYLRGALNQFLLSLAEIAIRNRKEAMRAVSLALLKLNDDMKGQLTVERNR